MNEPYTDVWSLKERRAVGKHFQPKVNIGFDSRRELILMMISSCPRSLHSGHPQQFPRGRENEVSLPDFM